MKKLAILLLMSVALAACSNVETGHVGVKVERYGDNRGVQPVVLGPGRYWSGWNIDIIQFPTYTQTDKWTKSPNEGSALDQSITFQAAGGIGVTVDMGIAYHVTAENVPKVFIKYRRGIEEISDNFLRNMVRNALNERGIAYDTESLQGLGKQKLLDQVLVDVQKDAEAVGITVESLSYLSDLRFPPSVVAAINSKIQATQDAMRVENEVRKTKAEAEKQVVIAEAQVRVAEADAKAIEARGKALQSNNAVLQLRDLEIRAEAVHKWDGHMPTYNGGGVVPFINVGK